MADKRRSYAAMVFVNVSWGLSFVMSKHAMNEGFPPMTLAFVRYVFAAVILVTLALTTEKRPTIRKGDWPKLFLSGLTGITFYYFFEYKGISLTTTVNASLILAAIPILTMLVEAVAYKSKLSVRKALGAALSLMGVALIVLTGKTDGTHSMTGDLLIMGASLVWVGYIFISRKLRDHYSSLWMNTLQALVALVTLFPLALTEKSQWVPVSFSGWACAFLLAAICSALCYWLYGNALHTLTPLTSAIFINLIPLTTIIGGVLLLSEQMTWLKAVGGMLIVVSIFLVTIEGQKKSKLGLANISQE